jgi:Fe-Mn family superoxide dismutase
MKHELPKLNFEYNTLEPYIDAQTMELHYSKHHQTYVTKLNAALEKHPELFEKDLSDLLKNLDTVPEDIRTAVKNHGGGHFNHTFFWTILTGNSSKAPLDEIEKAITSTFGNFETFKTKFSEEAVNKFGSGWAWLVKNSEGNIEIINTSNQDSPISLGKTPLLTIDVWEHAYYLKYQNRRNEYIEAWWNVVNWEKVNDLYKAA